MTDESSRKSHRVPVVAVFFCYFQARRGTLRSALPVMITLGRGTRDKGAKNCDKAHFNHYSNLTQLASDTDVPQESFRPLESNKLLKNGKHWAKEKTKQIYSVSNKELKT